MNVIMITRPIVLEYARGFAVSNGSICGLKGAVETSASGASCIHDCGTQAPRLSLSAYMHESKTKRFFKLAQLIFGTLVLVVFFATIGSIFFFPVGTVLGVFLGVFMGVKGIKEWLNGKI